MRELAGEGKTNVNRINSHVCGAKVYPTFRLVAASTNCRTKARRIDPRFSCESRNAETPILFYAVKRIRISVNRFHFRTPIPHYRYAAAPLKRIFAAFFSFYIATISHDGHVHALSLPCFLPLDRSKQSKRLITFLTVQN